MTGRVYADRRLCTEHLRADLAGLEVEVIRALFVAPDLRILSDDLVAIGCQDTCLVPVRRIVQRGLALRAVAFFIAHNHPSGNCRPSPEDERCTQVLFQLGRAIEMQLLDHVVVARDGYYCILTRQVCRYGRGDD